MAQAVGKNRAENRKAKTEQGNEDDGENCANQAAGKAWWGGHQSIFTA
jgi:hypothetical protein